MKLHRLELEGFGPFRERQSVDFGAFTDDGLFLLTGRTGAGKSSVLDGVCFALYGSVPRYGDGDKRLRSDHCDPDDPSEVVLDFEVSGGRWRVARSPEYQRPKRRGEGLTTEGQRAQLDEWVDGEWMTRASGPRDVGLALDEVLGLTRDQFLQVILLAQGRFQQFLLAKNDERQALLRTLFGTRRYADYMEALEDRRRSGERELGERGAVVGMLLDQIDGLAAAHGLGDAESADSPPADIAERLDLALRAVARADYRAEASVLARDAAAVAFERAAASHTALQARVRARAAREGSRAALSALEEESAAVEADRVVLDRAARAEQLRDVVSAADRAEGAVERAAVVAAGALTRWQAVEPDAAAEPEALRTRIEAVTGNIALWRDALAIEQQLDELRTEAQAADAAIARHEASIAAIDDQRTAVPGALLTLDERIAALAETAAGVVPGEQALAEVDERLTAAQDAERLAGLLHTAETGYTEKLEAFQTATSHLTTLMRRRLAGHAGELAGELVDGEPCAVCGSLEHPAPASAGDPAEAVTADDIADAERAKDAAADAERRAGDAAREARTAHAAAAARSGGETVAALGARRTERATALAAARAAKTERDGLAAERATLVELDAAAAAERDKSGSALAAARERAATVQTRVREAEQRVTQARGDAASVSARIDAAIVVRDAAKGLADALDARRSAEAERTDAARQRDERIAASVFAGENDAGVREALRDEPTRAALDKRIRAHEQALASEKQRLMQLELDLADDDGAELDEKASAALVADANDSLRSAHAAAAEARQTATALHDLTERADAAHAATAELAARFAVVQRLAHTVAGRAPNTHLMTLETFVLAAELEEIVERANLRLSEMSAGRYRLQHTDALARRRTSSGLGLEIMDSFTGQARPPQSLSGGETFLASLALALGLAEAVTADAGGIRLDTLFIDEGFGSLDAETLDLAMRTLDELRQGGRIVGVISHVEAMKEQVPAQLRVEATPQGPSRILQGATISG